MSRRAIDPVERALQAWLALDGSQRQQLIAIQRGYQLAQDEAHGPTAEPRKRKAKQPPPEVEG